MFNIFKKKPSFTPQDYAFFKEVILQLPDKYGFLKEQINPEFILGKKENILGTPNSYTFLLNANLESNYINKSLPDLFIIKDIGVWNRRSGSYGTLELYVMQGMLAGYFVKSDLRDLDSSKVDMSVIKEKNFANEDKDRLMEILGAIDDGIASILDLQSTFKIVIEEGTFYVVKDLDDGNYLSVNSSGQVYIMLHDPYKVEKIFDNKDLFLNALKTGDFNIEKFYESQFK